MIPVAGRTLSYNLCLLLLLTAVSGCLGAEQSSQAPVPPSDTTELASQGLGSGATIIPLSGMQASIGPVTPLPDRLSTEPSIAIQPDGDLAVSGLATDPDPSVSVMGGYVWVSRDRGASFTLERDRTVPHDRPVGCASCDTTLVARDGRFVLGTYYREVNPAFDVSIAESNADGSSWQTLHPGAAKEQPIDRPWLAGSGDGTLLLVYRKRPGIHDPPTSSDTGEVFAQWGQGSVGTWSQPSLVIAPDAGDQQRSVTFEKPEVVDGRALIPVQVTNGTSDFVNYTNYVAIGGPSEGTWDLRRIGGPEPSLAAFDLSIDANSDGTVVAAWTAPSGSRDTHSLRVRVSRDAARSWGPVRTLPVPGSSVQPWVAVRDDGLVAVSYHGSSHTGRLLEASEQTAWWPRTVLFEADRPDRPLAVAQLNHAPIFRGVLCNSSPACPADARSVPMGEFLSADWGPRGSLYTAFTNATAEDPGSQTNPFVRDDMGRLTVTRLDVPSSDASATGSQVTRDPAVNEGLPIAVHTPGR